MRKMNKSLSLVSRMLSSSGYGKLFKACYHYSRHLYYCVRDNHAMNAPEGWKRLNPYLQVSFDKKGVKILYFFDYIPYNPYQMIETLKNEIGWEAPVNKEAKMDCKLHPLVNYKYWKETGITADGFVLSTLVRNGLLSRDGALAKEDTIRRDLKSECEKICKEMGINIDF